MASEKRTDLHPGDQVAVTLIGTFEEIRNHGTPDNPKWWAEVKTKGKGSLVVDQEDVAPYIEIPEALRYCSECGREVVWDDPRKIAPTLVCPRCTYDELRKFQRKTEENKRRGRWEYVGRQSAISHCPHRRSGPQGDDGPCNNGDCPGYVRGKCPFSFGGKLKPEFESDFRRRKEDKLS
ncbi:hypothetical protein [Methanofollis sp. W23]|uniref:hypothetical protein n=1 Tax=Methanofollis sp. W23 TaxID=2817849 RepID=UPI001AE0F589|nr:hypothetical protein [Methanofollis sp. W23]